MTFDRILDDGRLWTVRYDGEEDNCFEELFERWNDILWLRKFFIDNLGDLKSFFKITDVYEAIEDTLSDASVLECLMLDISPEADLDNLFRHLDNARYSEMTLEKKKTKVLGVNKHPSWLRIYAIKIDSGVYLVTGGAIKLTATMSERCHTLAELAKMESVRNYLIELGIFDADGFNDYNENE